MLVYCRVINVLGSPNVVEVAHPVVTLTEVTLVGHRSTTFKEETGSKQPSDHQLVFVIFYFTDGDVTWR